MVLDLGLEGVPPHDVNAANGGAFVGVPVEPFEDDEGVLGVGGEHVDVLVDLFVGGLGAELQGGGLGPQLADLGEQGLEGVGGLHVVVLLEVLDEGLDVGGRDGGFEGVPDLHGSGKINI